MYAYDWDPETGGLLLNTTTLKFSREPRPVYAQELTLLGFDQRWQYDPDAPDPYLWAEANSYLYRGRVVAKTKGGSLYTPPELIFLEDPVDSLLRPVDIPAMVQKNQRLLEVIVDETIQRIHNTWALYRDKVDVFYVAFSGGKDSVVLLDLVQRTLPHNEFKVLFADTAMEFPDTYKVVDEVERFCASRNIVFIRARSDFQPACTWGIFGPPATVVRWCCSVHKTAPQIIALRETVGKADFTGMAFVGVRGGESAARSEYEYVSLGEKHKGQYSFNPILDWGSAEVYSYIFSENLCLNEAYKKGNRRVGCLICPRAAERNDFMSHAWYADECDTLVEIIKRLYRDNFPSEDALISFIENGGWKARKNGRDIPLELNYVESEEGNFSKIKVHHPNTDWKEWIKTIGILVGEQPKYIVLFRGIPLEINVQETDTDVVVSYRSSLAKTTPLFVRLLKNVFRKAACCVRCRTCEADCQHGCIHMDHGILSISDDCLHCAQCHNVSKGCLIYKSLEMPKGGLKVSNTKSLNSYSHHAPKMEWFQQFFAAKDNFFQENTLGSEMFDFFKKFLRDAGLIDQGKFSGFAEVIDRIGLNEEKSWALMLTNLAYTPQINWIVRRIPMNEVCTREYTLSLLVSDGAKKSWAGDVWLSFSRLMDLPFCSVGLGVGKKEKNRMVSFTRIPWAKPVPEVILHALYRFAEACGGCYQFTLTRLLDHDTESDGVSPTQIFGLDRETMEKLLVGLGVNYPTFLTARFTLDLDTIVLNSEKTSTDVLSLL